MTDKPGLDAAYALRTPQDSVRLYRDWASSYDDDFARARDYRLPDHVAEAFRAAGGGGPVLDVGAGTGLVGAALAARGIGPVDGLDISAEMLAVAARKGHYRATLQADLTQNLPLADESYAGICSAGTFTHGHVGPEAFDELLRVARSGAHFALSVNAGVWQSRGFADKLAALGSRVAGLALHEVLIYGAGIDRDHGGDRAMVVCFRKT